MILFTISSGNIFFNPASISGFADAKNVEIAFGKDLKALPTIGIKFLKINVEAVLARFSKGLLMSPPVVRFPKKSLNAACIDAKDPENVSDASLAVVPVIPNFFCTTEIAFTMFAKDISPSSTVIFNSSCTSL